MHHPDALDAGSDLARRLQLRLSCQQQVVEYEAETLVKRALDARSRPQRNFTIGQRVFFFRVSKSGNPDALRAKNFAHGTFVGPGTIIGPHGPNAWWVSYGGRAYLVAPEHLRALGPDDETLEADNGHLRAMVEELNRALAEGRKRETIDFEDLWRQSPVTREAVSAAEQELQLRPRFQGMERQLPAELEPYTSRRSRVYRHNLGEALVRVQHDARGRKPAAPQTGWGEASLWPLPSTWVRYRGSDEWHQLETEKTGRC